VAHLRRPTMSGLRSLPGVKRTSGFVLAEADLSIGQLSLSSDPTHSPSLRSGERPSGVLGS
jgi:hypothetical protein